MTDITRFIRMTGQTSVAGGVVAFGALVTVLAGEAMLGPDDFMTSAGALAAGWAGFVGAALFSVGLVGFAVVLVPGLTRVGRTALGVLVFAQAITTGSMATLALVVPHIAERLPEFVAEPPAAVPPTFIFSGIVSGICAIVIAVGLRRAGRTPTLGTGLLLAAGVVTMVPLPSRFFLLAVAVGLVVLTSAREQSSTLPTPEHDFVPR